MEYIKSQDLLVIMLVTMMNLVMDVWHIEIIKDRINRRSYVKKR